MKLTRERKIYAGLLTVAVAAILIDQVLLSEGPSSAHAGSVGTASAVTDHPSAMPAAPKLSDVGQIDLQVTELNTTNSLAHRLAAVAKQHDLSVDDVGNAFVPAVGWIVAPPMPVELAPMRGREFESRHKLTAVVTNARGGLAMVDGKPLEVGQEIDGFVLVSVTPISAEFRSGDVTASLELKLPGADSPVRNVP